MSFLNRIVLCAVLGAAIPTLPAPAEAQDEDQTRARQLFEQGVAASDAGRWEEALQSFEGSAALVDRASTRFNIANALLRVGRPVAARAELQRYLERPGVQGDSDRLSEARELLTAAEREIAEFTIQVEPPHATLHVDHQVSALQGASRTLPLDPGSHTLELSAEGFESHREEVSAVPGTAELSVELAPAGALLSGVQNPNPDGASEAGIFESPVFWGIAAAVVVVGVLTIVLLSSEGAVDRGNQDVSIPVP